MQESWQLYHLTGEEGGWDSQTGFESTDSTRWLTINLRSSRFPGQDSPLDWKMFSKPFLYVTCWKCSTEKPPVGCSLSSMHKQSGQWILPRSTAFVCHAQSPQSLDSIPAPPVSKSLSIHHGHLRKTLPDWEGIRACLLEVRESLKRLSVFEVRSERVMW